MKREAVKEFDQIENNRNMIFRKLKMMKKDSFDITGGNGMKDKDGKIVVTEDG